MPLSRTWYTNNNVALADTSTALRSHASMLHNLLKMLCGITNGNNGAPGAPPSSSYWTVHSSCNGTTASAGNNFNNTFTAGEWVRAAAGVAHSWFVLQSPSTLLNGTHYVTVSLGTASDQNIVLKIAKTAPSGGTTTADPTSASESTYTSFQSHPNSVTAGKSHMIVDADGNFHFWSSKNGAGYAHWWMCVQGLVETASSGDNFRTIMAQVFTDSGRGAPGYTTTISARGFHLDGTAANTTNLNITYLACSSSTGLAQHVTQLRGVDSKADGVPCAYVVASLASNMGVRGRLPDVWLSSGGPAVGAGDPSGAAPTRVVLGGAVTAMAVVPGL